VTTRVGNQKFQYRIVRDPLFIPPGIDIGEVSAVGCDSNDDVILYSRGLSKLTRFTAEGQFISDITIDEMEGAHGMYVAPDNTLFCTDQVANKIFHLSSKGELLDVIDGRKGLFDQPTDCCILSDGTILVSDGYGHTNIHAFSEDLEWVKKWGKSGSKQDELILPHCVRTDKYGRIYVCDRENDRIVVHKAAGEVIAVWKNLLRPSAMLIDDDSELIYVAELDYKLTILNFNGEVLCQFGQGKDDKCQKSSMVLPMGLP
jgi:hypothetical protein